MLHPELDPGLENRQQIQHRAVSLLQDSMAILDKLLQLDHGNRIWIANLAYDKAALGTLLQSGGDNANGAQLAAAGIGSLLQLAAAPNASMDELDLATSAALAIRPAGLRNPDTTTRLAERLVALDHRRNPSYLLTLAQAYRAQGQPARAAATAQEALSLLPPATPGSPSSRTRRLLELESHP
jgi:tetratricopeptide (TPR) repeat protein